MTKSSTVIAPSLRRTPERSGRGNRCTFTLWHTINGCRSPLKRAEVEDCGPSADFRQGTPWLSAAILSFTIMSLTTVGNAALLSSIVSRNRSAATMS